MKKMLNGLFGRGKGTGTKSSQISKPKAASSEESPASDAQSKIEKAKNGRKCIDKDNLENEGMNLAPPVRRKSLSLKGGEATSDPSTPTGDPISDIERKKLRFRQQMSFSSYDLTAEEKPRAKGSAFSSSMNHPRRKSLPMYINPKNSASTGCLDLLSSGSLDTSDESCRIHRPEDVDDVMLAKLVQEETRAMAIVNGEFRFKPDF
ncbi:hypothetical protein GUITHDRAFT_137835 [Guillardia theta CCMP2712]|uniref:Uncharacterized protein n=1 Tax=Guillardia theta (strain CCMP2712) TaxID=905079 RepID=L1JEC7_GUITC|nr:hypothetical protein GUITHDRAFT_137835 [Guillardia theta CCMP2712]EKX46831.1 hypothetical protein GUITHDRAFT_137835 [Guillardia theta CCMP2712]|eukprot:XP_005833811.1 hypothetical protein GUITHDRAFT_137835 [Guillardia theta CCMP2712]